MDPFISPYYNHFRHAHPEWYESFDRYRPGAELLRVARSVVPLSWAVSRSGIWFHVRPGAAQLPEQGWKIHVSATQENCEQILEAAARVCASNEAAFKFAVDRKMVFLSTSKGWQREASGKFITIYPVDEDHFKRLLDDLYPALQGFVGPYVLSDKRYKDCRVLYYRYGGISGLSVPTVKGDRKYVLRSPDGRLVPDGRQPYFSPPDWVRDPFPAPEEGAAPLLKDGRYQVERVLSFSVTGGVYAGTDLDTGSAVVIKEARSHTGVDANGQDATARLEREYRFLQKLAGTGIAPAPIDLFWDWEHLFLVEEFVPGMDLVKYTVTSSPIIKGRVTEQDKAASLELTRRIWINLALAVETIHDHNIVYGDMSLGNILLISRETGDIRIVDFEGAWEEGVDQSAPWFDTPGYAPPGGVRGRDDDIYGLGALMFATLFPVNTVFALEPAAKRLFIESVGADLGLSERTRRLLLDCMSTGDGARPTPAEIVEVLSHDFYAAD